ncbi:MAG TPA: protein kinase [Candidatus Sulfotelmatobacter sp.]|jgi:serine/threonine-protein kinase|nr:protein kinase [Candidatus Sulfotelmatobacter sp.]
MADDDVTRAISPNELETIIAVGNVVAGNYRILAHAGAGGMGIVYRAHDLKLERTVALKLLPSDVNASEKDKQNFLKEARIASSLDHPNIGAIYGIETTTDGRTFIVMAFYDGPSLAERIRVGGPIKVPEAIDIAMQMARGLAEAHSHNIVHRDIKPSNVMFTATGLVKIVDFGLAHVSEQTATLTRGAVGTVGYMPPEQALNQGTDQRADIWALGVVLAEMLTQRNPFQRDSVPSTVLAVLNDPPTPLDGLPLELQKVVYKALSKDRLKRYQSCAEVIHDLETGRAALVPPAGSRDLEASKGEIPSAELRRRIEEASKSSLTLRVERSRKPLAIGIALMAVVLVAVAIVWFGPGRAWLRNRGSGTGNKGSEVPQLRVLALLPFRPVAGNGRLTALGQGLTESVGAKLSNLEENRSLEIIPARNLQEKGFTSLSDARRQFGANLGLSVALEQTGDLVRVSYSLMNVQSGSSIGGDSITVPAADVFSVEDDVVEGTVKALQLKLRPEDQTILKVHGTAVPAAYNYYLQAQGYLVDYTKLDNVENAILMNKEALKLDPNFGAAKASLGEAHWRKYDLTKDKRLTEQAKSECDGAVTLGSAGAAGHVCLGLVNAGTGRYREAAVEFQRSVELEPGNESAAIGLASALEHQGAIDDAETAYQRVVDSHPQSYFAYNNLGAFYYRRSEYEKAIRMFQKVTELAPENYAGYLNLGGTYNDLGRLLEAIAPLKKSIALRPSYGGYSNLGTSYFGLQKLNEAAAAYDQAVKLDPRQYVTWGNLGAAQYYGGSKPQAAISYRKAADLASEELRVNPHDVDVLSDLSQYYAMLNDKKQASTYLGQAFQYGHSEKELLASAAGVYNQLGETGLALEWMTKAIQAGYSASKFRDSVAFHNLVDNPRYQEIVGKAQTAH